MFANFPQFSDAAKTSLEAQLSTINALTGKTFESFEKLVDLNLKATRATLENSGTAARQLLSAKDPQEFFSLTAAQAQPAAAKVLAYGNHLAGIASGAQAELNRTAEEQIAAANRKVSEFVDGISKNAPAGTENLFALFKSAVGNANAGYQQFNSATKQAFGAIETQRQAAMNQFSQAVEKSTVYTTAQK